MTNLTNWHDDIEALAGDFDGSLSGLCIMSLSFDFSRAGGGLTTGIAGGSHLGGAPSLGHSQHNLQQQQLAATTTVALANHHQQPPANTSSPSNLAICHTTTANENNNTTSSMNAFKRFKSSLLMGTHGDIQNEDANEASNFHLNNSSNASNTNDKLIRQFQNQIKNCFTSATSLTSALGATATATTAAGQQQQQHYSSISLNTTGSQQVAAGLRRNFSQPPAIGRGTTTTTPKSDASHRSATSARVAAGTGAAVHEVDNDDADDGDEGARESSNCTPLDEEQDDESVRDSSAPPTSDDDDEHENEEDEHGDGDQDNDDINKSPPLSPSSVGRGAPSSISSRRSSRSSAASSLADRHRQSTRRHTRIGIDNKRCNIDKSDDNHHRATTRRKISSDNNDSKQLRHLQRNRRVRSPSPSDLSMHHQHQLHARREQNNDNESQDLRINTQVAHSQQLRSATNSRGGPTGVGLLTAAVASTLPGSGCKSISSEQQPLSTQGQSIAQANQLKDKLALMSNATSYSTSVITTTAPIHFKGAIQQQYPSVAAAAAAAAAYHPTSLAMKNATATAAAAAAAYQAFPPSPYHQFSNSSFNHHDLYDRYLSHDSHQPLQTPLIGIERTQDLLSLRLPPHGGPIEDTESQRFTKDWLLFGADESTRDRAATAAAVAAPCQKRESNATNNQQQVAASVTSRGKSRRNSSGDDNEDDEDEDDRRQRRKSFQFSYRSSSNTAASASQALAELSSQQRRRPVTTTADHDQPIDLNVSYNQQHDEDKVNATNNNKDKMFDESMRHFNSNCGGGGGKHLKRALQVSCSSLSSSGSSGAKVRRLEDHHNENAGLHDGQDDEEVGGGAERRGGANNGSGQQDAATMSQQYLGQESMFGPDQVSKQRFEYVLAAPISVATKITEDTMTYLNQGQAYEIKLENVTDVSEARKGFMCSIINIGFHERHMQQAENELWQQWSQARPSERIFSVDMKLSYNVFGVESDGLNKYEFLWDSSKIAGVFIRINSISTEFTPRKHGGEKGIPFKLSIETFSYNSKTHDSYFISAACCQIKVFKPKGAERKIRSDRDKISKRPHSEQEKHHRSCERTLFRECSLSSLHPLADGSLGYYRHSHGRFASKQSATPNTTTTNITAPATTTQPPPVCPSQGSNHQSSPVANINGNSQQSIEQQHRDRCSPNGRGSEGSGKLGGSDSDTSNVGGGATGANSESRNEYHRRVSTSDYPSSRLVQSHQQQHQQHTTYGTSGNEQDDSPNYGSNHYSHSTGSSGDLVAGYASDQQPQQHVMYSSHHHHHHNHQHPRSVSSLASSGGSSAQAHQSAPPPPPPPPPPHFGTNSYYNQQSLGVGPNHVAPVPPPPPPQPLHHHPVLSNMPSNYAPSSTNQHSNYMQNYHHAHNQTSSLRGSPSIYNEKLTTPFRASELAISSHAHNNNNNNRSNNGEHCCGYSQSGEHHHHHPSSGDNANGHQFNSPSLSNNNNNNNGQQHTYMRQRSASTSLMTSGQSANNSSYATPLHVNNGAGDHHHHHHHHPMNHPRHPADCYNPLMDSDHHHPHHHHHPNHQMSAPTHPSWPPHLSSQLNTCNSRNCNTNCHHEQHPHNDQQHDSAYERGTTGNNNNNTNNNNYNGHHHYQDEEQHEQDSPHKSTTHSTDSPMSCYSSSGRYRLGPSVGTQQQDNNTSTLSSYGSQDVAHLHQSHNNNNNHHHQDLMTRSTATNPEFEQNDEHPSGGDPTARLTAKSTCAEVFAWLVSNRFALFTRTFNNFSGSDLMRLSKSELSEICGLADGIRLFNCLHGPLVKTRKKHFRTIKFAQLKIKRKLK